MEFKTLLIVEMSDTHLSKHVLQKKLGPSQFTVLMFHSTFC